MRRRRMVSLAIGMVAAALASCAPPEPAGLSETDREEAWQLTEAFVENVLAKDWEALAELYTEDAVLMPPGAPPVNGREAIKAYFENFPNVTELTTRELRIEGRADFAAVAGNYEMTLEMPGSSEPVRDEGKFLDIREKQPDGQWRFVLDMFNSNQAPPPPPAPED